MSKSVKLGFAFATTVGFDLLSSSANAGNRNALGAGLLGFGVGAIVGSTLAPREVYVVPSPPPPAYYGSAAYGPPPWSPGWFNYCRITTCWNAFREDKTISSVKYDTKKGLYTVAA